jgi:hypothetical protein
MLVVRGGTASNIGLPSHSMAFRLGNEYSKMNIVQYVPKRALQRYSKCVPKGLKD